MLPPLCASLPNGRPKNRQPSCSSACCCEACSRSRSRCSTSSLIVRTITWAASTLISPCSKEKGAAGLQIASNIGVPGQPVTDSDTQQILDTLKQATASNVVVVDLEGGKAWWETRLLVLLAGAVRLGKPDKIVFLGKHANFDRQFRAGLMRTSCCSASSSPPIRNMREASIRLGRQHGSGSSSNPWIRPIRPIPRCQLPFGRRGCRGDSPPRIRGWHLIPLPAYRTSCLPSRSCRAILQRASRCNHRDRAASIWRGSRICSSSPQPGQHRSRLAARATARCLPQQPGRVHRRDAARHHGALVSGRTGQPGLEITCVPIKRSKQNRSGPLGAFARMSRHSHVCRLCHRRHLRYQRCRDVVGGLRPTWRVR